MRYKYKYQNCHFVPRLRHLLKLMAEKGDPPGHGEKGPAQPSCQNLDHGRTRLPYLDCVCTVSLNNGK